jgi:hypothetical protein
LRADNIYLKGGSNMAEAIKITNSVANSGVYNAGGGASIAMRMK